MKYNIVYADPPWSYSDKSLHKGGAARYYSTMGLDSICSLPVESIVDDNCALFLWVTFPHLNNAFKVINSWGFKYKTIAFNWVKKNKKSDSLFWGMGHYTRSNSEICLLGLRGKLKRVNSDVHSVLIDKVTQHSKKPFEIKKRIVRLFGDIPRIELFARDLTDGWDAWGNEVDSNILL